MYPRIKLKFIGIIVLYLSMYTSAALATDCNERSPNFSADNDEYYDLDANKELTNNEKKEFGKLLKKLSGKWKGSLVHLECKGSIKNSRRIIQEADVDANIRNSSNNIFHMDYEAHYLKVRRSSLKKLKTLGQDTIFTYELKDENNIVFSEKYRRTNANRASYSVENIYEISLSGNTLKLVQTTYFNGFFAWSDKWSLKSR